MRGFSTRRKPRIQRTRTTAKPAECAPLRWTTMTKWKGFCGGVKRKRHRAASAVGDNSRSGGEMPHDFEHARIQADVFGRAPAGHHQRVVGRRLDGIEIGVERKIVAALFAVGLI